MKERRKSFGPPSEADLKYLEKFRCSTHLDIGIAQALYYCATRRIPPPEWLVKEAALP